MRQRENSDLNVPDYQVIILVFLHECLRIPVTTRSIRIGKPVSINISFGFSPGQRIVNHLDVNIALSHPHTVFVQPGTIGIFLNFKIIRNRCARNHDITSHCNAQLVGADAIGDILVKIFGVMHRNIQRFAEMISQTPAQIELNRYSVR